MPRAFSSLVALAGLAFLTPAALGETVGELLVAVATAARFPAAARADVRIDRTVDATTAVGPAILVARGTMVYLEIRNGMRALWRPGKAIVLDHGRIVRAAVGQPLPSTDLLVEDLAPFTADALKVPQVSDDSPAGVVVVGAPAFPSAYVLLAHTIDRDRLVLTRTQYYRDTVSNLVKLRRDGDFVQVDGRWRPGQVEVEDLRQRTSTKITLTWRSAPDAPPAVFTPAGLRRPSGLAWPAPSSPSVVP
jgi:hypothetical protein